MPESFRSRAQNILRGVVEGLTNKESAERFPISEMAVKSGTLQRLFEKVGTWTRTRGSLVRIALEKYRDYVVLSGDQGRSPL